LNNLLINVLLEAIDRLSTISNLVIDSITDNLTSEEPRRKLIEIKLELLLPVLNISMRKYCSFINVSTSARTHGYICLNSKEAHDPRICVIASEEDGCEKATLVSKYVNKSSNFDLKFKLYWSI
jgi:hypothetical protein